MFRQMVIGKTEDHGTIESATIIIALIEGITLLIIKGLIIRIEIQTKVIETDLPYIYSF